MICMNKIKTLFRTFINSFKPSYYTDVVAAPASFSWKYFTMLNVMTALGVSLFFGLMISRINLGGIIRAASSQYPTDLVITVADGKLSINQELPYRVPFNMETLKDFGFADKDMSAGERRMKDNFYTVVESEAPTLVTFVSQRDITPDTSLYDFNSIAVVTENNIYMIGNPEEREEIKLYPVPETERPVVIDSASMDSLFNKITDIPMIKHKLYVPTLVGVMFVLLTILFFVGRLVIVTLYSLVVTVLASLLMRDKALSYGKVVQVSFHSITLIMVIGYIFSILKFGWWNGWMYFFAFIIWTLFVMSNVEKPKKAKKRTTKVKKVSRRSKK